MHLPPISLTLLLAGVLTLGEVGHQGFLVVLKGGDAFGRDATDGMGAAAGAACGNLDIAGVLEIGKLDGKVA